MDLVNLQEDLIKGKIPISIHGQGYVGLPLGVLFAKKGVKVIGVTKDKKALEMIRNGISPIHETDSSCLLDKGARKIPQTCQIDRTCLYVWKGKTFCPNCLRAYKIEGGQPMLIQDDCKIEGLKTLSDHLRDALDTGRYEIIDDNQEAAKKTKIHIICVPTYAEEYSLVIKVCKEIASALQEDGHVIINKSTVPVGATDEAEEEMKKITDKKFFICHMQERIAEGRALKEFQEIARTVGGRSKKGLLVAKTLFEILGPKVYTFDNPQITEASKIFENAYRDTNVAIANAFAFFCEKKGLDVYEVIKAANTNVRTQIFQPGMVGGHCLPEDTHYVAQPLDSLKEKNVIKSGRMLNDYIPLHGVDLVKKVQAKTIAIFGVAFKGNSDDIRNSGAYPITKCLEKDGYEIYVYDPWVKIEDQKKFGMPVSLQEALDKDIILILTDHHQFYSIDFNQGKSKTIIDMRHVVDPKKINKKVIRFGAS